MTDMKNSKSCLNIEDINEADIIKLFSHYDIIVSEVDIDKENNSLNVYIEVSIMNTYAIDLVELIIKKLKTIRDELSKEGLTEDMSLGDLYKGIWRISINFKTEQPKQND